MKVVHVTLSLIVIFVLVGCTPHASVKDLRFTKDNKDQVMESVRKSKDLTGEEVGLLIAALMRDALSGGALEGKTVGQVIDEQRRITADAAARENEQKRLAEEARKKEEALAAEINKYLVVTVYEKGFREKNIYSGQYNDFLTFKVAMQNAGAKSIRAFRGTIVFKDLFESEIYSANLSNDDGLAPGQKKQAEYTIRYNQFVDAEVRLKNTALANMKVVWRPKTILFGDGTKLGE